MRIHTLFFVFILSTISCSNEYVRTTKSSTTTCDDEKTTCTSETKADQTVGKEFSLEKTLLLLGILGGWYASEQEKNK